MSTGGPRSGDFGRCRENTERRDDASDSRLEVTVVAGGGVVWAVVMGGIVIRSMV